MPSSQKIETAADIAAAATSLIPWLGGPLSYVLGGYATGRRINRVSDAVKKLTRDLQDFKSEASEKYVQSEDFEELADATLRRVYEERNEEKRAAYKNFLVHAIKYPGDSYDEQIRILRALESVQFDHIRVLQALSVHPTEETNVIAGSPSSTLVRRLQNIQHDHVKYLIDQLNDLRLTDMRSFNTMMTGHGAENLHHFITPFGKRFMEYIIG